MARRSRRQKQLQKRLAKRAWFDMMEGGHATFEAYCKGEWEFRRDYADKLIAASKVIDNLHTIVCKPASESQARPLAQLPAEKQVKIGGKDNG